MKTIEQYKVHPEADKLPKMTDTEFNQLCESIKSDGLHKEIIILSETDRQIIDGRHRYKACIETGIPPRFITIKDYQQANEVYLSKLDLQNSNYLQAIENGDINQLVKEIIKIENVYRRADNTYNAIKQYIPMLPKNGEIGNGRKKADEPDIENIKNDNKANVPEKVGGSQETHLKTKEELASELGVSEATIKRVKYVEENGTPEIKAKVDAGEIGIFTAAKLTRQHHNNLKQKTMKKPETKAKPKPKDWYEENVPDEAQRFLLKELLKIYKKLENKHGVIYIKMFQEMVSSGITHLNYKEKWNQVN